MYGRDDTKIVVYSMGRWPKEGDERKSRNLCNNIVNSCNFGHQQDIIIYAPQATPRIDFLILLVFNDLKSANFIVYLLE